MAALLAAIVVFIMIETSSPLPAAGVGRRLAALVYDAFLLFGLLVAPLFLWILFTHYNAQTLPNDGVAHTLPAIAPKRLIQAYWILVVAGFYSYFWRKNGQTLGMQAWRLRLENKPGGRPSWRQCGLRLLIAPLSLLLGGCGYWWIWLDRNHQSWHDRASNTVIVVLPKQIKTKNYA